LFPTLDIINPQNPESRIESSEVLRRRVAPDSFFWILAPDSWILS
jgi:hypothetical protein